MTYRQLLPDRFAFGAHAYAADSYPIRVGLPDVIEELQQGTETDASSSLHFILCLLAWAHLGYPCCYNPQQVVDLGVALSLHFIRGEWTRVRPDLAPTSDKRPDNPEFEWIDAYSQGLLVTLLSDREVALRELADWPEAWMETGRSLYRRDPLEGKLFLVIANEFRSTPFGEIAELRQSLRGSRRKHLKLLSETWEAVLARDQDAFAQNLIASVQQWERSYDGNCAHPKNCIAEDASSVLAAGRRLGMRLPEFEPRLAARLLTPESIQSNSAEAGSASHAGSGSNSAAEHPLKSLLQSFGIGERND